MNLTRIKRLLNLLRTLQNGNGQNASGLAKACGVSRRTVFRDLETLRKSSVPIEFDKTTQRYCISESHFLPPINFTPSEALSIIALAGLMEGEQHLPFHEPAHMAALKIESSLPAALRDELQPITNSIQIQLGQINPLENMEDVYSKLLKAISKRQVVEITYESLTEWDTIVTKLKPYHLLFSRRSWYVIGHSSLHKEIRTFNLGRISDIKSKKQAYKLPKNFSLKKHLRNAWHLIPEPGDDSQVVIRFKHLVAKNVEEVTWHKTQQTRRLEDGSLEFRARVSGLSEISWWVLGYGDQAEVIKPARLRKLVAQRAASMHKIYNE